MSDSPVVPDFDDGVPVINDAEPEDAEVEHLASTEEVDEALSNDES